MTQARPDMGRRPRNAAEGDDEAQDKDGETAGDLYGMLPLIEGMPVMLTDHVDRSPDKMLLRGRIGYIQSWELAEDGKNVEHGPRRILQKLPQTLTCFEKRKAK